MDPLFLVIFPHFLFLTHWTGGIRITLLPIGDSYVIQVLSGLRDLPQPTLLHHIKLKLLMIYIKPIPYRHV